jgi:hypothetical protein
MGNFVTKYARSDRFGRYATEQMIDGYRVDTDGEPVRYMDPTPRPSGSRAIRYLHGAGAFVYDPTGVLVGRIDYERSWGSHRRGRGVGPFRATFLDFTVEHFRKEEDAIQAFKRRTGSASRME